MPGPDDIGFAARCLARATRQASLATVSDGAPFVSLVTPAMTCGGDLLMLISSLSRHGRHLRHDGRCAVLLGGALPEAESPANPQAAPRLTLTGTAELTDDPLLRERWVRIHPYGALYAGFGDFSLWRLRPEEAHFVAGFGQISRLPAAMLRPACDIGAQERALLDLVGSGAIIALDADGFDLGPGPTMDPNGEARTRRIAFAAPAETPEAIETAIASMFNGGL